MGVERGQGALKYRCPATHYRQACAAEDRCHAQRDLRIPLSQDRRVFTPLARSSDASERAHKQRAAVERANSRLDVPIRVRAPLHPPTEDDALALWSGVGGYVGLGVGSREGPA